MKFAHLFILIILLTACKGQIKEEIVRLGENLERPEFSEEFMELVQAGSDYLSDQEIFLEDKYELSSYERWDYNQETKLLSFSDEGVVKLEFECTDVGFISTSTETWMWSWHSDYERENGKSSMYGIRDFGASRLYEPMTKSEWKGNESDGRAMAGVAAYLLRVKGAHQLPNEDGVFFILIKEIRDLRK